MYAIKEYSCGYTTPWEKPIDYRIERLLENKPRKVAYLYERADTSTFRYRVYNICEALNCSAEWGGSYFFADELEMVEQYLDVIDLVILGRYRWSSQIDRFLNEIAQRKIKVSFEIDDMVYSCKYVQKIMNTLSVIDSEERYDYWFAYTSRLGETLKRCDCAITTNEFLSKRISTDTGIKCYDIQNTFNYFQELVSKNYYDQKQNQKSKGEFILGYFSGTPSHINDFLSVAPEVLMLLDEYEDIRLLVVGFMEFPYYMNKYLESGQIIFKPLTDFIMLQKYIAEVDVNIVPLVDNIFTSCKSELKYFEAAIVGTVTCASPTFTYRNAITNGENGFLCKVGEWYETLKYLYINRNGKKIKSVRKKAYEHATKTYAYYCIAPKIERIFNQIIGVE